VRADAGAVAADDCAAGFVEDVDIDIGGDAVAEAGDGAAGLVDHRSGVALPVDAVIAGTDRAVREDETVIRYCRSLTRPDGVVRRAFDDAGGVVDDVHMPGGRRNRIEVEPLAAGREDRTVVVDVDGAVSDVIADLEGIVSAGGNQTAGPVPKGEVARDA
jgi:hypothetical protein